MSYILSPPLHSMAASIWRENETIRSLLQIRLVRGYKKTFTNRRFVGSGLTVYGGKKGAVRLRLL